MNALIVSVDFADLLDVTLEYNRHQFDRVIVVTTPQDIDTQIVAGKNNAEVFQTESFYDRGAIFNKHKAMEEGLDFMGREGWICLMDADVLWPKKLPHFELGIGNIYGPLRRVMDPPTFPIADDWQQFPHYLLKAKVIAGFSQIFHGSDPALGKPPWHELDWTHGAGADTSLQKKWSKHNRRRLPFSVLHLGEVGVNWCGRLEPYLDGSIIPFEKKKREDLAFHTRKIGYSRRNPHERIRSEQ